MNPRRASIRRQIRRRFGRPLRYLPVRSVQAFISPLGALANP